MSGVARMIKVGGIGHGTIELGAGLPPCRARRCRRCSRVFRSSALKAGLGPPCWATQGRWQQERRKKNDLPREFANWGSCKVLSEPIQLYRVASDEVLLGFYVHDSFCHVFAGSSAGAAQLEEGVCDC